MDAKSSNNPGWADRLAHHEVIVLAILNLGGESSYVHTEHIAVEANKIAPGRFRWVHYADQINIHNIKTCLWKSKSSETGYLVIGSDKLGWMLTEKGREMARKLAVELPDIFPAISRQEDKNDKWKNGERSRLISSDAFKKFVQGGAESATKTEVEAFFRLNEYVTGDVREKKIARLLNVFGDDPELGNAVKALSKQLKQG
jgi:hypothetical protein